MPTIIQAIGSLFLYFIGGVVLMHYSKKAYREFKELKEEGKEVIFLISAFLEFLAFILYPIKKFIKSENINIIKSLKLMEVLLKK
ncbi:MAG: hypothetical protein GY830_02070 [Bacteroidetes bacterium]|nr:hypothetical protein [Bacteroidota bacterium]